MPATTALLEREDELAAIARALDSAAARDGGLLAVEGEAGIGKTSLLEVAATLAAERGMTVLAARGSERERDFPYGVVRQLFEPSLAAAGEPLLTGAAALAAPVFGAAAPAEADGDPFGIPHGLYWLAADLAERAPLALVVDDVQWADLASLRALAHIAHRIAGLPLLLAVGVRSGEPDAHEDLIDELRREARRGWLRPRPLGPDAVAELVARELGGDLAGGLAEACCVASAGNPFLVGELLQALAGDGRAPADLELAESLAAAGAARSILLRLMRLGDDALAVARAVAVLEPAATPLPVAALSGCGRDRVTAAAERLVAAHLLADATPLAFAHPLVRAAIYGDIPQPRRAAMHASAALLLREQGAAADAVAGHLLWAEPAGQAWVAAALRAAAADALGRGAPESAVRYLRRALHEPPAAADRDATTAELGFALLRAVDPEGIDVLAGLRARSPGFAAEARLTADLATSLGVRGRTGEALRILSEALAASAEPHGPDGWHLRGTMLLLPVSSHEGIPPRAMPEPGEAIDATTSEGRFLLEGAAFLLACGAGTVGYAGALLRQAVADPAVAVADAELGTPPLGAFVTLTLADDAAGAEALYEPVLAATRRRGSLSGVATGLGTRAIARFCDGDLRAAEADVETALAMIRSRNLVMEGAWRAVLVSVLVERGELAAAREALAARGQVSDPASGLTGAVLACARGRLHLASGRFEEARADFLAAARMVDWLPFANEEMLGWRTGLARVHAACGEREQATRLAADALEAGRAADSLRGVGLALRVQGQLGGVDAVETLRAAVELLAATNARLQHAHALVDLGAALRRANHRRDARGPLREGLDLAHRCGAAALERRARTELAAAGARPRRVLLSGVAALTPSELRVARMAAEGLTNREIAQQLFVTAKTVETHLSHAYRKLDVASRAELESKL